jgi:hypothetical protein
MLDASLTPHLPLTLLVIGVIVFAALAHGTVGFGFPVITTPLVATFTDIKTAIALTLFPNIAVNLISMATGGNWRESLGRYWPVAVYVLIGTIVGTRILLVVDPEPLKLFLAAMMVVYLQQARLRKLDWSALRHYPRASALVFGSLAGILSGTVNVTVPPLVIYFVSLGLDAVPMTQILNLCFLVGKATQALTFAAAGKIGIATFFDTAPLTILSAATLLYGMRIRDRIRPALYQSLLRTILWAMTWILIAQVAWHYRTLIFP